MRPLASLLARCWLEAFPPEGLVFEIGSYQTPGQDAAWALRSLLGPERHVRAPSQGARSAPIGLATGKPSRGKAAEARHLGADVRAGVGVDLLADGEALPFGRGRFAALAALDVLEHAPRPRALLDELARVLAPGGTALVATVLDFAIHAAPSDYWRFTPEGLVQLAEAFPQAAVGQLGADDFPHTVWLVLGGGAVPDFAQRSARMHEAYERLQPPTPWAWRLPLPWLRWAGLSRLRRRIVSHRHLRARVARA